MGNIFVIEVAEDKSLREKRRRLYCYIGVDIRKGFDSIHMEALWFKMRKNRIDENLVFCTNVDYAVWESELIEYS